MAQDLILYATATSMLACALVAGIFLAFSDFIMRGLTATGPAGLHAMQLINRKVYRSVFLILLMGMGPVFILLMIAAVMIAPAPAAAWIVTAGVSYIIGVLLITIRCNVPMNLKLDALSPASALSLDYWQTYATSWTFWNHIRTASSAGAAASLLIASLVLAGS